MKTKIGSAIVLSAIIVAPAMGHDGEIFEPAKGTSYTGIGNSTVDANAWEAATGGVRTSHEKLYIQFNSQNPAHPLSVTTLLNRLNKIGNQGQIPQMGIDYKGFHPSFNPMDQAIVLGLEDAFLDLVSDAVKQYGKPIFILPGYEFNLTGYTPYVFPQSFDYIVKRFRDNGVKNVAWVWNAFVQSSAPSSYDEQNVSGDWAWLPKETSINFMALNNFISQGWIPGATNPDATIINNFLDFAEARNKPVIYAETTSILGTDILPTSNPNASAQADFIWNNHFKLLFDHIKANDRIKGSLLISTNWLATGNPLWVTWGDHTIQNNQFLLNKFITEWAGPTYLNDNDTTPHPWIPWLEQEVAPGGLANIDCHNLQPGEQAVLFLGLSLLPDGANIGGVQGDWFLAPPVFFLLAFPAGPTGNIDLPVPMPNDPSLSGFTFYLQWVAASGAPKPQTFRIL